MGYDIVESSAPVGEYSEKWLSIQTNEEMPLSALNRQLLVLRTGFRTFFKDYTDEDFQLMQSLWYEVFKHIPEELFSEAISRFICTERKGFPRLSDKSLGVLNKL